MIGLDNGINHVNPVKKKDEKTLLITDIGDGGACYGRRGVSVYDYLHADFA